MAWASSRLGLSVAVLSATLMVMSRLLGLHALALVSALTLVAWSSEASLLGLEGLMRRYGLSRHAAGVMGSAFQNLPEALIVLMTGYRGVSSGHEELVEIAVLTTMIAAGFNLLLLSVLVLISREPGLGMEEEAYRMEAPLLRVTIAATAMLAVYAMVEGVETGVKAPPLFSLAFLAFYAHYTYRLLRSRSQGGNEPGKAPEKWPLLLVLGIIATLAASEAIAGSVEHLAADQSAIMLAFLLGVAGSLPEHGLALLTVRRGMGEVGFGNLLGGTTQSILIVYSLASLLLPFTLDKYVAYQFAALAAGLWITMKCLGDDRLMDKSEAVLVALLQLAVYMTLLEV